MSRELDVNDKIERRHDYRKNGGHDDVGEVSWEKQEQLSVNVGDRYVTRRQRRVIEGAIGKPSTVCDGSLTASNRAGGKTICVGAILTIVLALALSWLCSREIVTV